MTLKQVRVFLEMVRFEHTIFALPFAYLGMVLAAGGWPGWRTFIWITVAMAAARTFAFAINRLADRFYDARNPRTRNRALPQGRISPGAVGALAGVALLVLALAAWQLNPFVLALLPGALVLLVGYSYTKRFTWASHWVLGITDGMATAGAWAAVTASLAHPAPWLLWLTVTVWMAGFDIIYACQDVDFDRVEGLHSVPARFGIATALQVARGNHVLTVLALAAYPVGNLVRLDNGELAVVIRVHAPDPSRPAVRVIADPDNRLLERPYDLALWIDEEPPRSTRRIVTPVAPAEAGIDPLPYLDEAAA